MLKKENVDILKKEFIEYLSMRIPSFQMPAKDYFNRFNRAIVAYLKKNGIEIINILDLQNVAELKRIFDCMGEMYVYEGKKRGNRKDGLKYYIQFLQQRIHVSDNNELTGAKVFMEGKLLDYHGSKYERDVNARQCCIDYYGCKCVVCGFDFEKFYGKIGVGFIEVHHLNAISSFEGCEHKIDPQKDMRPVCSNCHSMLHTSTPPLSIDQLKDLMTKKQ